MSEQRQSAIAVLTGDLVGSTALSADQLAVVRARLAEVARACDLWENGLVVGMPQFFRGDSWQMALGNSGHGLRAAVALRAGLLSLDMPVDTRISIGIGGVERLNADQVSVSVGEAFTLSGLGLDAMDRASGFRLALPSEHADSLHWLFPLVELCGAFVGRFKPWHADVAWRWIAPRPPLQREIADATGRRQSSVSEAMSVSGMRVLEPVLGAFARGVAQVQ
ncbi:MAG: hypothetical protein ACOY45_07440 [Pseudomonadota bacterium]